MKLPKNYNNSVCVSNRKMGKKNEEEVLPLIKSFFLCKFDSDKNCGWSVIDFIDEEKKVSIENKSRKIKFETYDTIMISYHKYTASRELMKKGYKAFFSFYFEPNRKLYLYELKDKLEYDVEIREGGTNKRGLDEYTKCLYIPRKYLFDIEKYYSYEDYKTKTDGLTYL